jgi:hypothetical protein
MKDKLVTKFGPKKSSGLCSSILCCAWLLILAWIIFLLYCWYMGFIDSSKVNNLSSEVNSIISNVENEIKSVIQRGSSGDADTGNLSRVDGSDVHIVFSTDCSEYQDW